MPDTGVGGTLVGAGGRPVRGASGRRPEDGGLNREANVARRLGLIGIEDSAGKSMVERAEMRPRPGRGAGGQGDGTELDS